ncbi:MAG: hypothetical protein A2636_02385 [Elusimicrobia bacterium RIFCSPHIGHO2_01_FULL_64_10]|nr:MAG: hypothetical protein A2636_02385 [Elusimicrobia bacterium RIFCSPHIGHO2_01_FULL_64_10]
MRCSKALKFLAFLQDGALSASDEGALRAHLQDCPACRNEERAFARAWSLLGTLESAPVSPCFKESFWRKAREAVPRTGELDRVPWWEWPAGRPAFALASLVLAALLGTAAALKLLPGKAGSQAGSPISRWTQDSAGKPRQGGFPI